MDDKENEFVTKSHLASELKDIKRDIERIDGSFDRLELMFTVIKDTFVTLTDSTRRMATAQERTNDAIIKMNVKQTELELRQKHVEEDVEEIGEAKKTYISDVFKLVGIFTGGILTLLGTIITAVLMFFK